MRGDKVKRSYKSKKAIIISVFGIAHQQRTPISTMLKTKVKEGISKASKFGIL